MPELYACMGKKPGWWLALYCDGSCTTSPGKKLPGLREQFIHAMGKAIACIARKRKIIGCIILTEYQRDAAKAAGEHDERCLSERRLYGATRVAP